MCNARSAVIQVVAVGGWEEVVLARGGTEHIALIACGRLLDIEARGSVLEGVVWDIVPSQADWHSAGGLPAPLVPKMHACVRPMDSEEELLYR